MFKPLIRKIRCRISNQRVQIHTKTVKHKINTANELRNYEYMISNASIETDPKFINDCSI